MAQWLNSEQYGNGLNGEYAPSTGTDAPVDSSCSGAAAGTSLSATNASFGANNIILIHQSRGTGVGQWELNVIDSYTAGTITTKYALAYTYTDSGASQAQVLVLKQYSSALIDTGVTLTAKAWDGNVGGIVAFMCNEDTTITETILTSSKGFLKGNGSVNGNAYSGEGSNLASTVHEDNTGGSGGGCSTDTSSVAGAGGGNGTAGGDGSGQQVSKGGIAVGNTALTLMDFGGGGGGGCNNEQSGSNGNGGPGAGIVLIFSKTITITGAITNSGGNGTDASPDTGMPGGGGAGGSVLIKCNEAVLGTNLITAAAGSKGATEAGNGGVGRVAVYYGTSYTGDSNPAASFTEDSNLIPSGAAGASPLFFGGAGAAIA